MQWRVVCSGTIVLCFLASRTFAASCDVFVVH